MVSTADEILPGYTASQTEANKNISGCLTSRSLSLSKYIVYYKEQTLESMANLPQVVNPNLHEDFLNLLQELQLSSL